MNTHKKYLTSRHQNTTPHGHTHGDLSLDDACHAISNDVVTLTEQLGDLPADSEIERGRAHELIIDRSYADAGVAMAGGEKAEFKYDVMESLGVELDLQSKTLRYPPRKIPALKTAIREMDNS